MKKSLVKFLICTFAVLLFAGCKNFFQGGDFLEELNESIILANASSVNVNISTLNGTVSNNGDHTLKVGQTITVAYTEGSSGYQFVAWNIVPADAASFAEGNANTPTATFKIESSAASISISPKTYVRPKLVTEKSSPAYDKNGVPKNSSIYFTFTQKLSSDNDLSRIQILKGNDTLLGNEDAAENTFTAPRLDDFELTIPARNDNMPVVTSIENVEVHIPGDFYYTIDDNKISFGDDLVYTYRINNETVDKAEINFSCTSGTIIPNGVKYYNIGDTFDVEYTKLDSYDFAGWEITVGDYDQVIEKDSLIIAQKLAEDGTVTQELTLFSFEDHPGDKVYTRKCKVLNLSTGISFKPVGELKPMISDYEPKYDNNGCDYDNFIVIRFNKEMDESKLTNAFISIKNQITNADLRNYFTFFPVTENGTTTVTLKPSYALKDQFENTDLAYIEIKLNSAVTDKAGKQLSGIDSWFYCIKNNSEKVKPKWSLHIYKSGNPENPYSEQELNLNYQYNVNDNEDKIKENHAGKPYICITNASDNKSGLDKVKITETLLKDTSNNTVPANPITTYYDYDENNNSLFIPTGKTNSDGETLYDCKFYYIFQSKSDGVAHLKIELLDKAGNATEPYEFDVIKDTFVTKELNAQCESFKNNPEMLIPLEYRQGESKSGMDIPYPLEYTSLHLNSFTVGSNEYYTFSNGQSLKSEQKVLIKIQQEGEEPQIIKSNNSYFTFDVENNNISCDEINNTLSNFKRNNSLEAELQFFVFTDNGIESKITEKYSNGPTLSTFYNEYNKVTIQVKSKLKNANIYIQYKENENDPWSELKLYKTSQNQTFTITPSELSSAGIGNNISKGIFRVYGVDNNIEGVTNDYNTNQSSLHSTLSKPLSVYLYDENPAVTNLFEQPCNYYYKSFPTDSDIQNSTNGAILKKNIAYIKLPEIINKPDNNYKYLYSIYKGTTLCGYYNENETAELVCGSKNIYKISLIAVNNNNVIIATTNIRSNWTILNNIDIYPPVIPSIILNKIQSDKNVTTIEYNLNSFKYKNGVPRDSTDNRYYTVFTNLYYYFVPESDGEISIEDLSKYEQNYIKLEKGKNCNYDKESVENSNYQSVTTTTPNYELMKNDYFIINFDDLDYGKYHVYYYLKDEIGNESFSPLSVYHNNLISHFISSQKPEVSIVNNQMTVTTIPYAKIGDFPNKPKENITNATTLGDYAFNFCTYQYIENNEWKDFASTGDDTYQSWKIMKTENDNIRTVAGDKNLSATLDVSNKKFIRIISKCSLLYTAIGDPDTDTPVSKALWETHNETPIFFTPVYVCVPWENGEIAACENKSWIDVENGKQIFFDAPCFVHTMYSSRNYTDETTPEAATEWEKHGNETGLKYKETTSFTSFTYTNDNLIDVPDNCYYTTIAHFADGTVLMTKPKLK